ncbi:hypothetical protein QJQ45_022240 [Haematococcus lacustris]|nr:hypothetical protein QJQ45_022240 [Haematococcus lacustris]
MQATLGCGVELGRAEALQPGSYDESIAVGASRGTMMDFRNAAKSMGHRSAFGTRKGSRKLGLVHTEVKRIVALPGEPIESTKRKGACARRSMGSSTAVSQCDNKTEESLDTTPASQPSIGADLTAAYSNDAARSEERPRVEPVLPATPIASALAPLPAAPAARRTRRRAAAAPVPEADPHGLGLPAALQAHLVPLAPQGPLALPLPVTPLAAPASVSPLAPPHPAPAVAPSHTLLDGANAPAAHTSMHRLSPLEQHLHDYHSKLSWMGLQLVSEVYQDLDLDLELEDLLGSPSQHSPAQSPSPGGEEAQQQGQVQQEQKQLLVAATTSFCAKAMPRGAKAIGLLPEQSVACATDCSVNCIPDVKLAIDSVAAHQHLCISSTCGHRIESGIYARPSMPLYWCDTIASEHIVGDAISQWQRALLLSSQTAASSSAGSPGPTSSTSTSTPLATGNASSQGGSTSSEHLTGRSHSLADAGASSSSSSGSSRVGGQGGGGAAEAERLSKAADRLAAAARPLYCHLLLPVSKEPGGIRFLTQLRADVLQLLRRQPAYNTPLRGLAEHLRQALAAWFTPGLLECQRLSWEGCSGALLDKVAAYEAVHPILGWADLRRRFDPHDRRVHAWFHPCLPGEPLIILHAALMQSVPHTLTQLLLPPSSSPLALALDTHPSSTPAPLPSPAPLQPTIPHHSSSSSTCSPSAASPTTAGSPAAPPPRPLPTVAAFYSISATQPGLSGVDLGHALIQRVAHNIQAEFPSVTQLVTLSPLPGFRTWLTGKLLQQQQTTQAQATHSPGERPLPWDQGQRPQKQSAAAAAAAAAVPPPAQPLPPILLPSEQQLLLSSGASMVAAMRDQGECHPAWLPALSAAVAVRNAGQLLALLLEQQAWLQDPSAEPGVSAAEGAGWSGAAATSGPLQVSRLELEAAVRGVLLRAAARYLLQERRRSLAVDPVAHFHLSNGASVWRLNWGADLSQDGWRSSCGIMVNYRYQPDTMCAPC